MCMSKVFVSMFLKQYLFILKRFSASSWNMFTFLECNATKREMNLYLQTYPMFPKEENDRIYLSDFADQSLRQQTGSSFL